MAAQQNCWIAKNVSIFFLLLKELEEPRGKGRNRMKRCVLEVVVQGNSCHDKFSPSLLLKTQLFLIRTELLVFAIAHSIAKTKDFKSFYKGILQCNYEMPHTGI